MHELIYPLEIGYAFIMRVENIVYFPNNRDKNNGEKFGAWGMKFFELHEIQRRSIKQCFSDSLHQDENFDVSLDPFPTN